MLGLLLLHIVVTVVVNWSFHVAELSDTMLNIAWTEELDWGSNQESEVIV